MLGVTLPLEFEHGHRAVNICCLPPRVCQRACWKELSKDSIWPAPDPEVILSEAFLERDALGVQEVWKSDRELRSVQAMSGKVPMSKCSPSLAAGSDKALVESWLYTPHTTPPAFLLLPEASRRYRGRLSVEVLVSVLMVYVDDFLLAHDDRYDRERVLSLFTWGSKTELKTEESICLKGKQIHLKFDRQKNVYFLSLLQTAFIESMRGPQTKIPKSKFDQELATEDLLEMRSVAGSLQWVSGQLRPDVAIVSLSSRAQKTKYSDLAAMFEAVAHLQSTKHLGLNLFLVTLNETIHLLTFSDSSWANAESFASQCGCLTLLAEPSIVERTGSALLFDFKSSRDPRICRSTLAAEASAADVFVDRTSFLNRMICEMFQRTPTCFEACASQIVVLFMIASAQRTPSLKKRER